MQFPQKCESWKSLPASWEAISQGRESLNNLWNPFSNAMQNLKEGREAGGRRQVSILSRYHSFLFSFNMTKISWLMYSHAGLYVSKCRISHVMWSPQVSQAKSGWAIKTPWEKASKEHLHGIWSHAGDLAPAASVLRGCLHCGLLHQCRVTCICFKRPTSRQEAG